MINLAGVPSIVHALFGLGAFVYAAQFGFSILAASLTLADAGQRLRELEEKTGLTPRALVERAAFVAVTLGEGGVDVHTRGGVVHVPSVPPMSLADPTGVGDAFRGGFLKGFVHSLTLERCAQMGALAATYCLEAKGTQAHSYDLPGFVRRFREHFDDRGELDRLA